MHIPPEHKGETESFRERRGRGHAPSVRAAPDLGRGDEERKKEEETLDGHALDKGHGQHEKGNDRVVTEEPECDF